MRLGSPRLWIGTLSALLVVLLSLRSTLRGHSPGELTSVHGREAKLDGRRDCAQCHGGLVTSMTDACLECHAPVKEQMDARDGLHGVLAPNLASSCARCHSEHHGEDFEIVNRRSFALAGSRAKDGFDHELVGFPMDGEHLDLDCTECHENAGVRVLPAGARRFMGLDWACATCHEDAHEGRMVLACAQCHGQTDFHRLDSWGHEQHLALEGAHGELACSACHGEKGPRSIDAMGKRGLKLAARTCTDCHESPHRDEVVRAVGAAASLAPALACGVCHEDDHESFRDERIDVTPELHALTGFPLDAPHADVACADCHAPDGDFDERHPGRRADDCAACHQDPHGGQFEAGPFAEPGCVTCHGRERFEPHGFTRELHAKAELPLDGRHGELACSACHADPPEGEPRAFRGTPVRCESCHDDAHDGKFEARRALELAASTAGTCARCHDARTFSEVPEKRFDHAYWTDLPVAGAHALVACEACHVRSALPDDFGRTLGRVAELHGGYDGCVTCHADPHRGEFDEGGDAKSGGKGGKTSCARCHEQSSFRAFPQGFAHGRWTGFELTGAHAEAECSACHAPQAPDEVGRTWGRAKGASCAACHQEPHMGQFRVDGATDCARCHASAQSFDILVFDHDRDARFKLTEAHRRVECAECHEPWPLPDGRSVVRYRPLDSDCASCHGLHHEQARGTEGREGR